jgi:hypothetical protein
MHYFHDGAGGSKRLDRLRSDLVPTGGNPKSHIPEQSAILSCRSFSPLVSGVDPACQSLVDLLVKTVRSSHVGAVVLEASSGRILGIASKSDTDLPNIALRNFPAASLAKIIAALYLLQSGIKPEQEVSYPRNYQQLPKFDLCNPVKNDRVTSFQNAFAYSNAIAFARLVWQLPHAPEEKLNQFMEVANKCGFNARFNGLHEIDSPLIFDAVVRNGSISKQNLKLAALVSGFYCSYTSCLHQAALLAHLTQNQALPHLSMMVNGRPTSISTPFAQGPNFSQQVLSDLKQMLKVVVDYGTAQETFKKIFPRGLEKSVFGKSGTLIGQDLTSNYYPLNVPFVDGLKNWMVIEHNGIVVASVICRPFKFHNKDDEGALSLSFRILRRLLEQL